MKLKKISILFILVTILFSCNQEDKIEKIDLSKTDFIYLEGKHFKHKQNSYFPLMLNYCVRIREINNEFVIAGIKDYEDKNIFEGNTKDSALTVLRGHLQLIKEQGFNSIRLVGFNKINSEESPQLSYFTPKSKKMPIEGNYEIMFECLSQFLEIANDLDLRVMILLNGPVENPKLTNFTKELLKKFQNNSTIFAYDFMNEPLYFDNKDLKPGERVRTKESAFEIVSLWKDLMLENAPNQLFTIGFSEPIEVFEWDPAILPVDFVAFHTYHPLRVPNEIYWYSKYIDKPWMIGETSLPADNDSISYKEQQQYLYEIYKQIVNCGGAGLGWWSFQDVSWGGFEHDYTSILNHVGTTTTKDGKYIIKGSLKPVCEGFDKLKNYTPTNECGCAINYYNMVGYQNIVLTGKIVNEKTNTPIEGAVIRGWNKYWSVGANTFTDSLGVFTMYSNTEFVHFEISAPKMTQIKFDYHAEYTSIEENTIAMGDLPNQKLEYHNISYQPFLSDKHLLDSRFIPTITKNYIFNFEKEKFNKAVYKGKMEIQKLRPVKFE